MKAIPFYHLEDDIVMPRKFLENNAYAEALEAFVVVCTDCLLINRERKTVYLAKRKSKPMPDWWFIGGRVFAGEHEKLAIQRCIKREIGLDVDTSLFEFQTMKRYLFPNRQQEPQNTPCDSLCYIFSLEISDEDVMVAERNLDPNEYDTSKGLREFTLEDLEQEKVFDSIINVYKIIF